MTGQPHKGLFAALVQAAELRSHEFKATGPPTACASVTADQPENNLVAAQPSATEPRLNEFKASELADLAWAFATAGQC